MPDISRRLFLSSSAAFVAKTAVAPALPVTIKTITAQLSSVLPSAAQTSAFNKMEMTLAMGEQVQLFDIFSGKTWQAPAPASQAALKAAWSSAIDECMPLYRVYGGLKNSGLSPSEYYGFLGNPSYHNHFASAQTDKVSSVIVKLFPKGSTQLLPKMQKGFQSGLSKSLTQAVDYPELWKSDSWTPFLNNLRNYVQQRLGLPLVDGCFDGLSFEPRAHAFRELVRYAPDLMPPERLRIFRQVARDFIEHGKQTSSIEEMNMGYRVSDLPYRFGLSDLQNRWGSHNAYKLKM